MSKIKLTPTQRRILENIAGGRRSTHGFPGGRSTSGGLSGAFVALRRRGLLDIHDDITDAGRAAIAGAGE